MFCPNCGAKNSDSANNCQKCGFRLKAGAAPKFKGTMLMMDASKLPVGDASAGHKAIESDRQSQVPAPPAAAQPPPNPSIPPATKGAASSFRRVNARSKLHGTMLGVAPPSAGAIVPPSGGGKSVSEPPVGAPDAAKPQPEGQVPNFGSTLVAGTAPDMATGSATAPASASSPSRFGNTMVLGDSPGAAGQALLSTNATAVAPTPVPAAAGTEPTAEMAAVSGSTSDAYAVTGAMPAYEPPPPSSLAPSASSAPQAPSTPRDSSAPPAQEDKKPKSLLALVFLSIVTLGLYWVFRKKSD